MIRLLFFVAAFAIAALPTEAQILGARPATPRNPSRPVASAAVAWTPLPVQFSRRSVLWDGMEQVKQVMSFGPGAILEGNWDLFGLWQRIEAPGFSVAWTQRANPQIRLALSALHPAHASVLLEPDRWSAFVGSLLARSAQNVRVLCDDDSLTNPQMLRLMGWRTRVYECTFTLPAPANQAQFRLVAGCSNGNAAYVFTLEAPADGVVAIRREFERILISLEPVTK